MRPITFHVEAAGEFRPVELSFATESDVRRVRAWRKIAQATDAGEFAALAAKRWFYYSREGVAVASLEKLRSAIKRSQHAALAFLLVASARWSRRYDYEAKHPISPPAKFDGACRCRGPREFSVRFASLGLWASALNFYRRRTEDTDFNAKTPRRKDAS